jgi:hypothetical protein
MKKLILITFFLSACAARQPVVDIHRNEIFPVGTYTHRVRLVFPNQKSVDFQGVIHLTALELSVVGLSPFQTTLFRLSENRKSGAIKIALFHDSLKDKEAFFRDFYTLLRSVLLYSRNQTKNVKFNVLTRDELGYPLELSTQWKKEEMHLALRDYDFNHIPRLITMEHPKFNVTAKVSDYDL